MLVSGGGSFGGVRLVPVQSVRNPFYIYGFPDSRTHPSDRESGNSIPDCADFADSCLEPPFINGTLGHQTGGEGIGFGVEEGGALDPQLFLGLGPPIGHQ